MGEKAASTARKMGSLKIAEAARYVEDKSHAKATATSVRLALAQVSRRQTNQGKAEKARAMGSFRVTKVASTMSAKQSHAETAMLNKHSQAKAGFHAAMAAKTKSASKVSARVEEARARRAAAVQ